MFEIIAEMKSNAERDLLLAQAKIEVINELEAKLDAKKAEEAALAFETETELATDNEYASI